MSIDVIHDMSKNKRWSKTLRGLKMLLGCNAAAVRITCLGHATFLVELDGQVILTDLVRGERAYSLSLGSAQSASIARLFHWQTSLH
jgi:hypothetical protein